MSINFASSVPHFFSPASYSSWEGHPNAQRTFQAPGPEVWSREQLMQVRKVRKPGTYLRFGFSFGSIHAGALIPLPLGGRKHHLPHPETNSDIKMLKHIEIPKFDTFSDHLGVLVCIFLSVCVVLLLLLRFLSSFELLYGLSELSSRSALPRPGWAALCRNLQTPQTAGRGSPTFRFLKDKTPARFTPSPVLRPPNAPTCQVSFRHGLDLPVGARGKDLRQRALCGPSTLKQRFRKKTHRPRGSWSSAKAQRLTLMALITSWQSYASGAVTKATRSASKSPWVSPSKSASSVWK